ncbi:hypothetical protein GCM10011611_41470 [Aliidongia dinghuensis]|uniref:Uncharacterized protein n=1 Tax=Aliidongia dinghuensis TaxID=1867774 RepID=A0A8J2YY26_9PROT|nr:hypothetical protein [Aliidongia dinghuensis]GGF31052.1 hypothetical protein GCM10011611_41470 [Aliidongia dinghuensis]
MLETYKATMGVVPLANGRFAVRAIGLTTLGQPPLDFATRAEAEAWVLRHAMADDEEAFGGTGVIRPGDGQGVA